MSHTTLVEAARHCTILRKQQKIGINKVNINSDMRHVFRKTLEKVLAENPDQYAVVKLMLEVYKAVQVVVEEKIDAFGSVNKAIK